APSDAMRSAAAIAICAAAADASRRQSETRSRALPRTRRTIARVVDSGRAGVALWIALVLPSSFVVHKYGGSAGAVVYALVAALGASALQNLFWIPMFFVAVWVETRDSRRALELAWLVLALSPAVIHDIVTGTGYASNAIAVVLGLWWLTRTRHRDLAAAAWGVALASRANFLLLVPI